MTASVDHPVPTVNESRPAECSSQCPFRNVVTINDRTAFRCTAGSNPVQLRWRSAIRGDRTSACLRAYPVEVQS